MEDVQTEKKLIKPEAPDFIKEMAKNFTTDVSVDFEPNNPYITPLPNGFYSNPHLEGIKEEPSFYQSAKAQAYKTNATLQGISGIGKLIDKYDPYFDIKPDGWTPTTDNYKFINIRDKYQGQLLEARSPRHQDSILQQIYQSQKQDDDIANGSWLSWAIGGGAGLISDPMSYIPISAFVKYSKISSAFVMSAVKTAPAGVAYNVLSSAAEELDKNNGNLHDFLIDSFTKSVFSTILFGSLGVGASFVERMGLWQAKNIAKANIAGVDFKFKVSDKGIIEGYQAVNVGNLGAKEVSYYEDLAKSSFVKSGVFKVPFIGEGIIKVAGMPVFGSPLINLINSPSQVMRGFIDRVAEHSFITKGVSEGEASPSRFSFLMSRVFSDLTALSTQVDALFFERNGITFKNRIVASSAETALWLKDKGSRALNDLNKETYVSREIFNDEVQRVVTSEVASEHSSVNEAARMIRESKDKAYRAYRKAYNLPEDWLPPKTAEGFLTRVYDTSFLNTNRNSWNEVISNYLKVSDETILRFSDPLIKITELIENNRLRNESLLTNKLASDAEKAALVEEGISLKAQKNVLEENLQNELRNNPDLQLLVEDWNALSSDEAKALEQITKRRDIAQKEVTAQKQVVSNIKKQIQKSKSKALKNKTVTTAQKNVQESESLLPELERQEQHLFALEKELDEELVKLQELAASGTINKRFYYKIPDSNMYKFKNPNERLKFRKTYNTHAEREVHAKGYYDTIMNQTPEDTINQVMGRFTGTSSENPLKQRTLLIPDEILYANKFLTNDVMAKTANYITYLSRRTHLKDIFKDVSIEGGIEPIIKELRDEFDRAHINLSNKKSSLEQQLSKPDVLAGEKKKLAKDLKKVDKQLVKERKAFDKNKDIMNRIYEKMMGIQKSSYRAQQVKSAVMSLTAWANLPFVPFTMINDLSAIGLQHGMWPFLRDGLYPLVNLFGGILKLNTKDSEAFRKAAPSVHLGLQHVQMRYADRNWGMMTNPYLNMGRFVNTLEKLAHLSTNFTGTNYLDNFLQHMTGSVVQSELMRILEAHSKGLVKKGSRDYLYIRKYGIDPEKWSERMLAAWKKEGGGKSKLGGYQSNFWSWEDLEAANSFSNAVFRSIKDTQISAGLIDAPLFTDDNGPLGIMGSFIRGFQGWTFASVNRYVIPTMQTPDAQKMIGVMAMLATGYFVDPFRRAARGEEMFPENLTDQQVLWATINNSGYFSFFSNILANANLITGGSLLGNLQSDKYKNRTRAGLLGPTWGTLNRMADIIEALASNELNEADAKKMARMIPFANASWTSWMSNQLVEGLDLPKTRADAHAAKQI